MYGKPDSRVLIEAQQRLWPRLKWVDSASPLAGAILDVWDGTSCDVISVFLCLLTAHVRASCFLLFCTQRAVKTYSVPRVLQRSEESSLAE